MGDIFMLSKLGINCFAIFMKIFLLSAKCKFTDMLLRILLFAQNTICGRKSFTKHGLDNLRHPVVRKSVVTGDSLGHGLLDVQVQKSMPEGLSLDHFHDRTIGRCICCMHCAMQHAVLHNMTVLGKIFRLHGIFIQRDWPTSVDTNDP